MVDPETIIISCDDPERIIGAMNAVMPQLAPDVRERFNHLIMRYWQLYGIEGIYKRANNRSVATILAEYDGDFPAPIASGQVGDVRYELYAPPDAKKES